MQAFLKFWEIQLFDFEHFKKPKQNLNTAILLDEFSGIHTSTPYIEKF